MKNRFHEDNEDSEAEVDREKKSHARHKCKGCEEDCTSSAHHAKHAGKKSKAIEKVMERMKK